MIATLDTVVRAVHDGGTGAYASLVLYRPDGSFTMVALVHDAPALRGYVEAILRQGSGRVDAIFICAAYGASIAG